METLVKEKTREKKTHLSKMNRTKLSDFEIITKEHNSFVIGIARNRKISMCASHSCNAK
jgi:hypothetical protein